MIGKTTKQQQETVFNVVTSACLFLYNCIVYEHWPETHEFVTWTVELWNM